MKLIFTHMWAQARYRLFTWRGLMYSVLAMVVSTPNWPQPSRMKIWSGVLPEGYSVVLMAFVTALLLHWGVLSDNKDTKRESSLCSLPTLPISKWKRTLGDILLLVLVLFIMHLLTITALLYAIRALEPTMLRMFLNTNTSSWLEALLGALFFVPSLSVIALTLQKPSPSQSMDLPILLTTFVLLAGQLVLVSSGWLYSPMNFTIACFAFTVFVFVFQWLIGDVAALFPSAREWRGQMNRPYQSGSVLFFRDLLIGALPQLLALSALAHATGGLRGKWSAPSGMSIGNMGLFAFEMILLTSSILIAFLPILAKIPFLQVGEKGRAIGAGYTLPVSKSSMLRYFFVYGLIMGVVLWFGVFSADLLKPTHTFKMTQVTWSTTWIATKILMPTVWIFLLASIFVFLGARSHFWSAVGVFMFIFSLNFKFLARYGFAVSTMTIVAFSIILFLMIGLYPLFFPPVKQLPKTAASTHPAL
ncbi:MAG TPA: hypothetical protein DCE42_17830 [Myxococcales bacterium]|nr:hypothetical protein [Myxococcales bacterium]